ncbi:hypothetical protein NP603_12065 [Methylomonas sp. SURF-1]|uniref:Uncharacterized protein n=1 Tax=Methylomonas aurea TaxID=2952224 RepID=A0ABT1UHX8_9GAMM|nr:hypothetical protein [Methylomonas sp. SURF-1]MCQ8181846.1 hypothetical protein [Methylomonas sp. SURF-1]
MKKMTRIAGLSAAVFMASISANVFAEADNCAAFYPKVPYNCELIRVKVLPAERADFSAFETGAVKASAGGAQYRLRSVTRDTARALRAQHAEAR